MSDTTKLKKIKEAIENAQTNIQMAKHLLSEMGITSDVDIDDEPAGAVEGKVSEGPEGKIIEGIFDGQNMNGPDGKQYSVPANYASKSKLVEGDTLKLTITPDGSFVYKQIGPIDRLRVVGTLTKDDQTSEFRVLAKNKSFKVLLASVTYFKGESGDEVVILIPKDKDTKWAAVENIIKKGEEVKTVIDEDNVNIIDDTDDDLLDDKPEEKVDTE
ncbi:hypothetical protein KKG41_04565 [Patescibacteria group bacterium]|nr:hypothetical protein [Patescibacteria group bacterium]MBU1889952.1 hypothetical protein [Patescibacteria group bacterium]